MQPVTTSGLSIGLALLWCQCATASAGRALLADDQEHETEHESEHEDRKEADQEQASSAPGADAHEEGKHTGPEHGEHQEAAHHNNILGVRGMYVRIPGDSKGAGSLWGGGILFERILIHNRLALEVSTAYFSSAVEQSIPVDLLVKIPYEITPQIEIYAGGGQPSPGCVSKLSKRENPTSRLVFSPELSPQQGSTGGPPNGWAS